MGLDLLRRADWLDSRLRGYLLALALAQLAALAFLLATSHGGIDRGGHLLGSDFLSFWTSGQMLQAGGNVYDSAAHIAAQRRYFAPGDGYVAFFYPPTFLPFCYPLGALGYFPALCLWLALTGGAYAYAVRTWARHTGVMVPFWTAFAAFPPVLITITHGQTSFLAAALLGFGALLVKDRPWLAGALLGLATLKPQFGLLIPVVLVLSGQWRTIAAAAGFAAVLALLATLAFGQAIWPDWWAASARAQSAMAEGLVPFAKMQSLFAAARLLGAPATLAYALQAALALTVTGSLGWASWRRGYSLALASAVLAGALLVTPFVLDYDMALLAFPLVYLAAGPFRPWEKLIAALVFVAPVFARALAAETGIAIMPPLLLILYALLLRRALETPAPAGGPPARG